MRRTIELNRHFYSTLCNSVLDIRTLLSLYDSVLMFNPVIGSDQLTVLDPSDSISILTVLKVPAGTVTESLRDTTVAITGVVLAIVDPGRTEVGGKLVMI